MSNPEFQDDVEMLNAHVTTLEAPGDGRALDFSAAETIETLFEGAE